MIRNPAPHTAFSRPPSRRPIVAFRDNQFPQKEKPKAVGKTTQTVLDMAAVEPIKAAKRCQAEISTANSGFWEERRRHIADAYAIACGLENNPQAWRSFIDDDFWQQRKRKPTIEDRTEPLLHVMVFVFNGIDRNRYKRASKYAAGLKRSWIDNVPAQKVEAKIKKDGGIEALCRASAANKPKKAKREQSLKLLPASDAFRKKILALPEGEKAQLIIKRVASEQGVVARIIGFHPWPA